jgi:hypothetical protein
MSRCFPSYASGAAAAALDNPRGSFVVVISLHHGYPMLTCGNMPHHR